MTRESAANVEHLWFLNSWVTLRRPSHAGADGVSIMEHHLAFGDSPPLHVHHEEDEIFHLLEGEMAFVLDGEARLARAGETVVAPRGAPHSFRVTSPEGARCLVITTGDSFERLVRAVARRALTLDLPPAAAPTADQIAALSTAAAHAGIDILGPPLA